MEVRMQTNKEFLSIENLPDELLLIIFNQAETSLLALSWVCSRFQTMIKDDSLKLKKHYQLMQTNLANLRVESKGKLFSSTIEDEELANKISSLKTAINSILEISRLDSSKIQLPSIIYCPTGIEIEAFASEADQPIEYQNVFSIYNPSFFNCQNNINGAKEPNKGFLADKIQVINFIFKYMNTPVNHTAYQIIRLLLVLDISLQAIELKQNNRWQKYGKTLQFSYSQILQLMGEKNASNCLLQLNQGIELAQQNSLKGLMDALVKIKNNIQKRYNFIERMDQSK
jgi:hypothetical protein